MWKIRKLLCKIGIHWWSKWSSMVCGNVAHLNKLQDYEKYSYRLCHICHKEMPHSRHFYNIGVKEKNAKEFNHK